MLRNHLRKLATSAAALAVALVVAAAPSVSLAANGECGQPVSNGTRPVATDCLFILRASVDLNTCDPLCICDLQGNGGDPVATDGLACLHAANGLPGFLNCDCVCGTTSTTLPPGTSTTSTTSEPPTTTVTNTTTTTTGGGGACPDTMELTVFGQTGATCSTNADCAAGSCDTGLSLCTTVTELDSGWKGISHDADVNDQQQVIAKLSCGVPGAPCGVCDVTGIDASNRTCRCANDNQQICNEPFVADADDCGGAVCNCYLGPPLPLSAGNTPACVVNRLANDLSGTVNVDTGGGAGPVNLRSVVYLGIDVFTPCPYCGSGCKAPTLNLGLACSANADCDTANCSLAAAVPCQTNADCGPGEGECASNGDGECGSADTTVGDGVRDGTCVGQGSANAGQACDADAVNRTFPWTTGSIGGGASLDCFPDDGKNVSPGGLEIDLDLTTGTQQLTSGVGCGLHPLVPELCACGECSLDTTIPCTSNTDCEPTAAGTCGALGQRPDACIGASVCDDAGGGEGTCAEGQQGYCDAALRSNGEPFVTCSSNLDCAAYEGVGNCTLTRPLACFLPTITATGTPDPDYPVGVSTFCIPRTISSSINSVAGLPGPGRVINQGRSRKFCGGAGGTEYVPGSGCP